MLSRIHDWLYESTKHDPFPLIVVTHGHVIQFLVAESLQMAHPEILQPWNCSITILVDGRLVAYNHVAHLLEIKACEI